MHSTRVLLFLASCVYFAYGADLEVRIPEGTLRGTQLKTRHGRDIIAFIGIPYAEPPVGDLRFRDPVAKKGWEGVRNADTDGNKCVQYTPENEIIGDEDCLVLNVYTPWLHSTWKPLLPVMVFIHGGAYSFGHSASNYYKPTYLLDKDVVLVTLNYRLNVYGFFSTGDEIAPGNFGLKDQLLALKWVNRNIHAMGGDPNRVTVFGNSAGAGSASLHALSEQSQGYFQQYMFQSGYPLTHWARIINPTYYEYANLIGSLFDCPTSNKREAVECLRRQPSYELYRAANVIGDEVGMHFWPTIETKYENAILTEEPKALLEQGKLMDVPAVMGSVKDEGLVLTADYYVNDEKYEALRTDPEKEIRLILNTFQPVAGINDSELAAKCREFYLGEELPTHRKTLLRKFTQFAGDYMFAYARRLTIHLLRGRQQPIFEYTFSFTGKVSGTQMETHTDEVIGVCHGDELYYLFAWNQTIDPKLVEHKTKSEQHMIDMMVDFWTSFAIHGKPTSQHLPDANVWKPNFHKDAYLQIGDGPDPSVTMKNRYMQRRVEFWRKVTPDFPV